MLGGETVLSLATDWTQKKIESDITAQCITNWLMLILALLLIVRPIDGDDLRDSPPTPRQKLVSKIRCQPIIC